MRFLGGRIAYAPKKFIASAVWVATFGDLPMVESNINVGAGPVSARRNI